jgi:hypothetical protein
LVVWGRFFRYNLAGTDMDSIGGFDASGTMINAVGTSITGFGFDVPGTIPDTVPLTIMAGDTWHFHAWYRDTPAGSGSSNFTNGLSVTFSSRSVSGIEDFARNRPSIPALRWISPR